MCQAGQVYKIWATAHPTHIHTKFIPIVLFAFASKQEQRFPFKQILDPECHGRVEWPFYVQMINGHNLIFLISR